MGIFQDAQGQRTHKSLVGSCWISNSPKLLWLSLLHKGIRRFNQKCRRLSGHNIIHHFLRCSRGSYSIIGEGFLTKFKLIQALIVVLMSARTKKIHSKLNALEWAKHFSHYQSMEIFQTLKGRYLINPRSDPAKFRIHPSIIGCPMLPVRMKKILQSKVKALEW